MKKILAVMMLAAFAVTMFPVTTSYASQTVNCSWWGKMIHGEYAKKRSKEEQRRWQQEQQRRQQEQQRRQLEQQRRRQQQQRGY